MSPDSTGSAWSRAEDMSVETEPVPAASNLEMERAGHFLTFPRSALVPTANFLPLSMALRSLSFLANSTRFWEKRKEERNRGRETPTMNFLSLIFSFSLGLIIYGMDSCVNQARRGLS